MRPPRHEAGRLAVVAVLAVVSPCAVAADAPPPSPGDIRVLVTAALETTLSSQMAGTLGDLRTSLGTRVERRALLAQFDCAEAQARAKVAVAELGMARQNLTAKQGMRKLNAVGDVEVAQAETDVEKATGARSLATTQAGYCQVRAPFAARIAKVYVKPFQTVAEGTPLFDLVSDGDLKIRLNVPSPWLARLKEDLPIHVRLLETGKTYPAHISAINARVDAVAQTIELEARFDEPHAEVRPGMSGVAQLPGTPP
ncbi:efflux RND transporter periplasmic adaptor subunit [Luteibacter aegosomatissinici]|uniref:efflux RND transporter periplasmic adaptor subunit n=1 Tax=Luteibacter aegosomatissinici TaxID=2911539 RepID=UPI001FFA6DE2|nr:efflux RND transporter periplasmic adaptor subunit [Luteibacter aegosomatissinici]UPG95556.1 efflux RND transporter periplasmic adaptor subunit [Luteibacter aegosomatissinici]